MELLNEIRKYTLQHSDLQKSHHFSFNLPMVKNSLEKADVIVMGINPGVSKNDYAYKGELPAEESNEYDYHDFIPEVPASKKWYALTKEYLTNIENKKIWFSEFFFWSTPSKDDFKKIFGYDLEACPHLDFCMEMNKQLLKWHKPKFVVCPGISTSEFFSEKYKMRHIYTESLRGKRGNRRIIAHYEWNKTPFIYTPHWSAGFVSQEEKNIIIEYLENLKKN